MPKKPASKAPAPAPVSVVSRNPHFWLLKSEPDSFSWEMLVARGKSGESWDGVRSYQARNNMREMELGDLAFFYHSNEGKEIVGICEVSRLIHPDSSDATGTWECVSVRAVRAVPRPVSLVEVKANPKLAQMALVTSMRLSVQPVRPDEWAEVLRMAGLTDADVGVPGKRTAQRRAGKAK